MLFPILPSDLLVLSTLGTLRTFALIWCQYQPTIPDTTKYLELAAIGDSRLAMDRLDALVLLWQAEEGLLKN